MKTFTVLRFELSQTIKIRTGAIVIIVADPLTDGALIAHVDPSFCKVHPDEAVEALNLAFAAYDLQEAIAQHRKAKEG